MLRLEEQPHGLLAGARLCADEHEPATELRPDLQRMLPQPQPPTLGHGEIGDYGVEPLGADRLQPFDPVRRRRDPAPPAGQRAGAFERYAATIAARIRVRLRHAASVTDFTDSPRFTQSFTISSA